MLEALLIVMAPIALVSIYGNLVMRIHLMKILPLQNGFLWWKRSPTEVAREYTKLFPNSYWPAIIRSVFWLFLFTVIALLAFLWTTEQAA